MEWWALLFAGMAGGVIGGMGMGGGTLLIPILTLILGMSQLDAQLINLVSFIPMAIFTACIFARNHLLEYKKILLVLPPALVGSGLGAYLSGMIDTAILRLVFGSFLIAVSVFFLSKYVLDKLIARLFMAKHGDFLSKIRLFFVKRRNNIKSL